MTNFIVRKKLSLSFLGEGWEEAYLILTPFTFNDNIQLVKFQKKFAGMAAESAGEEELLETTSKMQELVSERLVEGKGFDGTKLVDITKEDLGSLPMEVFSRILNELKGETLSPKS